MTKQTIRKGTKRGPTTLQIQRTPQRVAQFEVCFHQILDHQGNLCGQLPIFAENPAILIALYQMMVKTRLFDKKAISLQRRGQLGTYASSMGQEAIGTAVGSVMQQEDVLLPTYREYAAQFSRGVTMTDILLYWGGSEQGMAFKNGPSRDFPICVPIASQAPHAVGVAYAMKLRGEKRVAVCILGDGGTSKGDFYEAINAAGVWQLPVVFIINNNQWAISLPRKTQTKAETLAQKAVAVGIPGEQVDGNDVIALSECFEEALERARNGGGPSLIEALTYRLSDHTTADDASRYRSDEELKKGWEREPLIRLRNYLTELGYWSTSDEQEFLADCNSEVEDAVDQYLAATMQPPESMFDYLYESVPTALKEQRRFAMKWGGRHD